MGDSGFNPETTPDATPTPTHAHATVDPSLQDDPAARARALEARVKELERLIADGRAQEDARARGLPTVVVENLSDESHEDRLERLGQGPYNPAKEAEKINYGYHYSMNTPS